MEMWTEAQMRSIDKMLNPHSIAVVGASPKGGYGGRLLNALVKAKERVRLYAVNPNYDEIAGIKAYPSVSELPEAPDLVGIVVPHHKVLDVLKECHQKKAASAVVISAGFAERGTHAGAELQSQVGAFARESGVRVAGPNCLGLANVREDIWACASSRTLGGLKGSIGLICQSGATAYGPFLHRAVDSGIGLSYVISTGNEMDLEFADFARYLIDDPGTRVIAGFVEGLRDVPKFIAMAQLAADRGKPIVVIKIGRSESGARAARSHTAAMTGADKFYDALFHQYGVIRVADYDDLLEVSQLLAQARRPAKRGVAVVSHSGGISSLNADMLGLAGFDLPPLSPGATDAINAILKSAGWAANPADITGFARSDSFLPIAETMINEPEVGTLVIASNGGGTQIEQAVALRDRTDKNLVYSWTAGRADSALPRLKSSGIPFFFSPERLARGLRILCDYHDWRQRRVTRDGVVPAPDGAQQEVLARLRGSGRTTLSERESRHAIAAWGIPSARETTVTSAEAAAEAAQRLGYPVALKIDSADILHKTEAGVVRLGLRDAAATRAAYEEIMANARRHAPGASVSGALVQEMVTSGVEMIVGVSYDPQVGPMLLCGTGGVMVEVYEDVALRHCPISRVDALSMIDEVKGAKLLRGFRGSPPCDINALADALVRISHMAVHAQGTLAELDINPLKVLPEGQGVKAVDALLLLKKS